MVKHQSESVKHQMLLFNFMRTNFRFLKTYFLSLLACLRNGSLKQNMARIKSNLKTDFILEIIRTVKNTSRTIKFPNSYFRLNYNKIYTKCLFPVQVLREESSWSERLSSCLATLPQDQYEAAEQGLTSIRGKLASLLSPAVREPLNASVTCVTKLNIPRSAVAKVSSLIVII